MIGLFKKKEIGKFILSTHKITDVNSQFYRYTEESHAQVYEVFNILPKLTKSRKFVIGKSYWYVTTDKLGTDNIMYSMYSSRNSFYVTKKEHLANLIRFEFKKNEYI